MIACNPVRMVVELNQSILPDCSLPSTEEEVVVSTKNSGWVKLGMRAFQWHYKTGPGWCFFVKIAVHFVEHFQIFILKKQAVNLYWGSIQCIIPSAT